MSSACATGRRAYIEGTSVPEFSEDGETYELKRAFDVRFLGDEPWQETPESLNALLSRLAA